MNFLSNQILCLSSKEEFKNYPLSKNQVNSMSPKVTHEIYRRKQDRLLFLRHASKCRSKYCSEIPQCNHMKSLWVHVVNCDIINECEYPDCVSSKYVLSEYAQLCRKYSRLSNLQLSPKNYTYMIPTFTSQETAKEDEEVASLLLNLNSPRENTNDYFPNPLERLIDSNNKTLNFSEV